MSQKPELLISVNTDPACPWCYIGGERLSQVLESEEFKREIGQRECRSCAAASRQCREADDRPVSPDVTPRVEILPYILDPRLTSSTRPPPSDIYDSGSNLVFEAGSPPTKDLYYEKKFPVPGQRDSFNDKINDAAKELGLGEFKFQGSGKARVGATWDAHRLISKAGEVEQQGGESGLQNRLSKRLYSDFHINSLDLSDDSVLAKAAVDLKVFPDEKAALAFLNSDEHDDTLRFKLQQADMNGVQSVPFYIVNEGADHLSETGSHEVFMRMFKMASAAFIT